MCSMKMMISPTAGAWDASTISTVGMTLIMPAIGMIHGLPTTYVGDGAALGIMTACGDGRIILHGIGITAGREAIGAGIIRFRGAGTILITLGADIRARAITPTRV